MILASEEQKMYDGEHGEAAQKAMEILVAMGRIYDADSMIPVSSAQISGVSYKTIGDAGLEYLEEMARNGAKVKIPSFLNPAGMDCEQWKEMGIPENFAKKQIQITDAYKKMGIEMTCTCTPYFVGIVPEFGEHIAWAESSAVAYANSVLGARTNREGGPSALAAAICGVTPNYGLHLDENRTADIIVNVECGLKTNSDFGAMGNHLGPVIKNKIPAFKGIKNATKDNLKSLGAALAATGSVSLFFVENITPEYRVKDSPERISFTEQNLKETYERLNQEKDADLITIGCPHASMDEIKQLAEIAKTRKFRWKVWIFTARDNKRKAGELGYQKLIENAGGRIVADTCMVVCPLEEMGYRTSGCNSGKAAKYLPNLCRQKLKFGKMEDIV